MADRDEAYRDFLQMHFSAESLKKYQNDLIGPAGYQMAEFLTLLIGSGNVNSESEEQDRDEEYNVSSYGMLQFYRSGDRIDPEVLEDTVRFHHSCKELLQRDPAYFEKLSRKDLKEKFCVLAEKSLLLKIRDRDWEKIFSDIEEHPDSYARYWSASHAAIISTDVQRLAQAYILNDDLYRDLENGKL